MRQLGERGIRTGALIAPVLPGALGRARPAGEVIDAITDAGGRILGALPLHLRPGTREHFLAWLERTDPALHARYLRNFGTRAYLNADYGRWLQRTVDDLRDRASARSPS